MTSAVKELKVGDIVMINPSYERTCFRGCLLTVTEVKDFGCQGFVQGVGKAFEEDGGQYYLRPKWNDFEITGGVAPWMIKEEDE